MTTLVTLKTGLDWNTAHDVLKAGGFVNHAHWNHDGNPTALGLAKDRFVIVEADKTGVSAPLHTWRPTEGEFQSMDWQEVTFKNV